MKKTSIIVAVLCTSMLTGCVNSLSGNTYSRSEARQIQQVQYGVVQSAVPVVLEGTSGIVGGATGAVVGGIAASNIGGGRGKDIATVLGAVAGGIAGKQVEETVTRSQGQEITVRLDNGNLVSIVQEVGEGPLFRAGDRVRVLNGNGTARVTY
ncbi:glycine zipper 2TM domain-containing protein [Neptuniibacter caesariensis]|uniref:Outer membrane lipoprotein, putative n=1 Tax=Neptuniibacter caesariensis TaxID=207954 RepID=A0A7U8C6S0_NEPCE|nr:glycine zipper 2TM domain-containing protein [Neptuniibacter caesariensis]EAR60934.1 outer membrane lipoprotein, putative [Oceanospirillum sp. MED92] [Neptuniibacter caesariensis]